MNNSLKISFDYEGAILPPFAFARTFLNLDLYPWQLEAIEAVGQGLPTCLLTPNESGKTTSVIAPLILWFICQYGKSGGKVVLTSGSWLQIKTQLMPAIRKFAHLFDDLEFQETGIKFKDKKDFCLISFSTDSPGRAEGHHGTKEAPLFIIVDEAKSVPDSIFEAIDRCRPQYLLFASSAGGNSGKFYRTFHVESSFFYNIKITYTHCPHLDKKLLEKDKNIYGENSSIFRSMWLGEFSKSSDNLVIGEDILEEAINNPPDYRNGKLICFCDFAGGGDENVLALRQGNKVWIESAWRDSDTVRAASTFMQKFRILGLTSSQIYADEGGLGKVICDIFKENKFFVHRVNNGSSSPDKNYFNMGSYIWFKARRAIEKKEIILPNDNTFFTQATTRQVVIKTDGRLALEPKEQMASRGLHSPDRADALLGAIALGSSSLISSKNKFITGK